MTDLSKLEAIVRAGRYVDAMTGQHETALSCTLADLMLDVMKAAERQLQEHLNDFGHGCVDEWPTVRDELGWGDDCPAMRLGDTLSALRTACQALPEVTE